jgi:hypothetical protein
VGSLWARPPTDRSSLRGTGGLDRMTPSQAVRSSATQRAGRPVAACRRDDRAVAAPSRRQKSALERAIDFPGDPERRFQERPPATAGANSKTNGSKLDHPLSPTAWVAAAEAGGHPGHRLIIISRAVRRARAAARQPRPSRCTPGPRAGAPHTGQESLAGGPWDGPG